jgi:addiction module HigA family antidote
MSIQQHNPPHPGGFIKRVYLEPNGLGSNEVAVKLQVSASTFNRLINEKSDMSPEMALKLSKVLGRSPESWLLMQDNFNLWKVKNEIDLSSYETIKFAC